MTSNILTIVLAIFLLFIIPRIKEKIFKVLISFVILGSFLNILAISLNNWRMPVLAYNEAHVAIINASKRHCLLTSNTRLAWLCDVIPIYNAMVSPGDLIMLFSIVLIFLFYGYFKLKNSSFKAVF